MIKAFTADEVKAMASDADAWALDQFLASLPPEEIEHLLAAARRRDAAYASSLFREMPPQVRRAVKALAAQR